MAVKLTHLSLIYGVAGAREKFEELTAQLIRSEHPTAERIRIVRGDGGIDLHQGELADPSGVDVFQIKFFPEGIGDAQKSQIRESFKTCDQSSDYKAKSWTLCIPIDMSIEESKWFSEWATKQTSTTGIRISPYWGATKLEGLLYTEKNRHLSEAFFKEEYLAQIREIHTMLRTALDQLATLDIRSDKLRVYMDVRSLLIQLQKESEIVREWASRIGSDDVYAQYSIHFPATGAIGRLTKTLADTEEKRLKHQWLFAWNVDACLYAIGLKGKELLAAVECYGAEKNDWHIKRGHLLVASGLGGVVSHFIIICSKEMEVDVRKVEWSLGATPSEAEFAPFFRALGDIGREESRRFTELHPQLAEQLREVNRTSAIRRDKVFRFSLLCDAILDRSVQQAIDLNGPQLLEFLEQLYQSCEQFYFRMWNESLTNVVEQENDRVRIEALLAKKSPHEILVAFRRMVEAVHKTFSETRPLSAEQFESREAFEKAKLDGLRPSALAYTRLRELTEAHLAMLKGQSNEGIEAHAEPRKSNPTPDFTAQHRPGTCN